MIHDSERPRAPAPAKPRAGDLLRVWRHAQGYEPRREVMIHSLMNSLGLERGQFQVWGVDGAAYRVFWDANFSEWREVPSPPQTPKRRYGQR